MSTSLRPCELQHARPPCPSPSPGVHSDSCPSSRWCHPAISSSVVPFSSCPLSLPASESFPMSQLFAWGGQSTQWLLLTVLYIPGTFTCIISFKFSQPASRLDGTVPIFSNIEVQMDTWLSQMCPAVIWPQLSTSDSKTHFLLQHHTLSKPCFFLQLWTDRFFCAKYGICPCLEGNEAKKCIFCYLANVPADLASHSDIIIFLHRKGSLCGSCKTVT